MNELRSNDAIGVDKRAQRGRTTGPKREYRAVGIVKRYHFDVPVLALPQIAVARIGQLGCAGFNHHVQANETLRGKLLLDRLLLGNAKRTFR